ncbi:MAG: hypothetical protein HKP38_08670 [Croceitalea sp.]|nr:hypothetical protein [Croceitalea sp.]MBT8237439.1 hypothetical protein [Croceitalea sp.]NNC33328.1 hypothetical protein [Croceitalea sp.]NNL09280.1 hypothetical protein [Croceitalea sp.]NNM17362.1 hypothetical protein [Croceitalea sp.]
MIESEKQENADILEKSIHYLQTHGFEHIKADFEGYEVPKSYLKKGSEIKITPDIVAIKNGKKYFFEISVKSQKSRLLKSKWLFLDTISRLKSDRFKIITTRGHYKFTDSILNEINLTNKKPIKI